jgi:hypothetical protein
MTILVAEVIFSNEKVVGSGNNDDDPIRQVLQVFTCDGQLLVEIDPWAHTHLYNPVSVGEVFDTAGSKPVQPD